jgi:hypothetical protein
MVILTGRAPACILNKKRACTRKLGMIENVTSIISYREERK